MMLIKNYLPLFGLLFAPTLIILATFLVENLIFTVFSFLLYLFFVCKVITTARKNAVYCYKFFIPMVTSALVFMSFFFAVLHLKMEGNGIMLVYLLFPLSFVNIGLFLLGFTIDVTSKRKDQQGKT